MKTLIFLPRAQREATQNYIDANNLFFDPMIILRGIAEPHIRDVEKGFQLSGTGAHPVTHSGLYAHFTAAELQGVLDNVPGAMAYACADWNLVSALADAGLQRVEGDPVTVPHLFALEEYFKIYDMADAPIDVAICAQSPKWNGHTCTVKYSGGNFVQAIEQGDNTAGRDVTDRVQPHVPATIDRTDDIQIEGEMIDIGTYDPGEMGHLMVHGTDKEYFAMTVKFLVFNVQGTAFITWTDAMAWADGQNFDTVLNYVNDNAPKDGEVYRINNRADEAAAPVGLFALKYI